MIMWHSTLITNCDIQLEIQHKFAPLIQNHLVNEWMKPVFSFPLPQKIKIRVWKKKKKKTILEMTHEIKKE